MKPWGAHNKEQHRPSRIAAFWGVVRPAWGLFRPLQGRGKPYSHQAAVIAARHCSIPRHEQHTEHAASWSKWGFTAAMQALVLGQSRGPGDTWQRRTMIFPWVSKGGYICKTPSVVVWVQSTQTNDSIEGSGIFRRRSRVHPGRLREETADVQGMLK